MPFGQTTVEYNGVKITKCVTEQFDQVPVFDQAGVELQYFRFTITFSGYCTGDDRTSAPSDGSNPLNPGSFAGGGAILPDDVVNPTDQIVWVRSHLMKPRHSFTMRTGQSGGPPSADPLEPGSYMIDVEPYPVGSVGPTEWPLASPTTPNDPDFKLGDRRGYDLNNGPKCLGCSITRIIGNNLLFVRATFEVCKIECETGDGRAEEITKGVMSNRWSLEDSIDANMMTVRTVHGRLRVTTPHIEANAFRGWVIPTLQEGYRRESMRFLVSEDGLTLDYTIIDKEIAYSVPPPATSWRYKYTESVLNSAMTTAEVIVMLRGNRETDKKELIRTAAAIANAKTKFLVVPKPNNFIINDVTCVDEYGDDDNSITLRVQVSRAKGADEMGGLTVTSVGQPITKADMQLLQPLAIDYNRQVSTSFLSGGYLDTEGVLPVINVFLNYLRATCSDDRKIEDSIEKGNINYYAENTPDYNLSIAVVPTLSLQTTSTYSYLDNTKRDQPYTSWQCESLLKDDKLRVQLPVAASVSMSAAAGAFAATSVVAALSQGVAQRIVRFKGTRIGAPPEIPAGIDEMTIGPTASSLDPKAKLFSSTIRPGTPSRTVDGDTIFTVDGEFIYALPAMVLNLAGGFAQALFIGMNPSEPMVTARYNTASVVATGLPP